MLAEQVLMEHLLLNFYRYHFQCLESSIAIELLYLHNYPNL